MKFTIDSATFKNITERASAVSNKTGFTVYETSVNLIADAESQKVIVKSTNLNAFAEVFTDNVSVQESGNVFVDVDDLKRLYNIIGDLTVESDGKTLLVRGSKKQGEVCATEQNNMDFPQVDGEMAFAADKEDMLDTFSKLSCCLESDMNGAKKLFAGFNVADVLCRPRIAALDGYRAAVRVTEWKYRIGLNITVPGYIVKELTKVSANKKTEEITVYASDKHARFVGSDFAYTTRLLKGKYLDIDSLLVLKEQTYAFEIAADKLFAVAKEYSGFLKKNTQPMFVAYRNGKFVAAAESSRYRTSDVLEVKNERNIPDDLLYGLNPNYLKDLMAIFGKQTVVIESVIRGASHNSWLIRGDNGYTALILPVRPLDDMSNIEKLLASA